jgi:uncharacterized protein YdhG (YjbR/CyaY superfamily)
MPRKPTTIDAYLARVPGERRLALEALRNTIRKAVPKAQECISYGIPAFRLGNAVIAGFAQTAKGCSYFPFSGSTLKTLGAELSEYGGTKSSLHFYSQRPLSTSLVRKLLKTRIAETKKPKRTARSR